MGIGIYKIIKIKKKGIYLKKDGDFMFLEQLSLFNFRNYDAVNIKLSKNINIFYGKNAQGKTNILEGIYFLGLAKSYRTRNDSDMLKNNKKIFKVEGILNKQYIKNKYLIKYNNEIKKYFIDSNNYKKISDYISNINIITFTPDDLEILKGIPDVRRRFIDNELGQLYKTYYKVNNEYKKILKMRNDLLKELNINHSIDNNYFNILTQYLIDKSVFIYRARIKFINKLNDEINKIYFDIINISNFRIIYKTQIELNDCYKNEEIRENLENLFKNNYLKEKEAGTTLYGPHRDDIEFYLNNDNLKFYGSQGQQKLSILAIKFAELLLFKKQTGDYPILLLDDVFSEFDREKINKILKYIKDDIQVIITSTDIKNIKKSILNNSKLFYIENGNVTEL